jgi:hypothetical protein
LIYLDQNYVQPNSTSSSPIFYEKPGIPEVSDDENDQITLSPNGTRRVKFSNAPIRVRRKNYFLEKIIICLGISNVYTK